ncbi:MAG: UBP-type zinc finger domain-containing protein [Acidimicrobiia bacterium]
MIDRKTRARFDDFSSRLAAGDAPGIVAFLADRFYGHEPAPGEPTAAARIAPLLTDLAAALPDLSIVLAQVAPSGKDLEATMRLTGTMSGPLWGAPPSGDRIDWTTRVLIHPVGERFAFALPDVSMSEALGLLRRLGLVNPPDAMHLPSRHPSRIPDFLMKVAITGSTTDRDCPHLDEVRVTDTDAAECEQCIATGAAWPALRMCLVCGFVGCCDTSVNRHMAAHAEATGHAVMRSLRMDEQWIWCYQDNAFFEGTRLDRIRARLG